MPPLPRLWNILAARGLVERFKGRSNSLFTSSSITKSAPSDIWEKIWVVPLPFLMLWATPVRRGRPGSTRGGEFLGSLRVLHQKSKSSGVIGEERSSVATSVARGRGSAPLLEPGRKSCGYPQECHTNRNGRRCSRPTWGCDGSSLWSCTGQI